MVDTIPGKPDEIFILSHYKEEVGKPYNRITLYLAKNEDILMADKLFSNIKKKKTPPTIEEFIMVQERESATNHSDVYHSATTSSSSSASTLSANSPSIVSYSPVNNYANHSTNSIQSTNNISSHCWVSSVTASSNCQADRFNTLKDIFPGTSEIVLHHAILSTGSLEEAVQLLVMHSSAPVYDAYTNICDDSTTNDGSGDDIIVTGEDDLAETKINMMDTNNIFSGDSNLQSKLRQWAEQKLQSGQYLRMKVRRNKIWTDTCMKLEACSPEDLNKQLKVQFVGEPAVDQGGPKREFFTLTNREATNHLLSGNSGIFRHNVLALSEKEFFKFGQLTSLGLLQGSSGPRCFTQSVTDYILYGNTDSLSPSIAEMPVDKVKEKMQQLDTTEDQDEFRCIASFECDFRFDCGYSKPIINIEDKELFFKCTSLHYTILASLKELEQYIDGLKTCDMLTLIRQHPATFQKVFLFSITLTAESLDEMFVPQLSPMGSNKRVLEEALLFNFSQLLEDIEKGHVREEADNQQVTVKLEDVLMFVTGAECIPAIGFNPQPTIEFQHGLCANRKLSASTCGNILKLPVCDKMKDYTEFKAEFAFCLLNSPGFGIV